MCTCKCYLCVCVCRFVAGWLDVYYSKDDDVKNDLELNQWITEINTHGYSQHSGALTNNCFAVYRRCSDTKVWSRQHYIDEKFFIGQVCHPQLCLRGQVYSFLLKHGKFRTQKCSDCFTSFEVNVLNSLIYTEIKIFLKHDETWPNHLQTWWLFLALFHWIKLKFSITSLKMTFMCGLSFLLKHRSYFYYLCL